MSLELQLWNERCVASLGQRISEFVTAYLENEKTVPQESVDQAELALFQRVASELSRLLETPVAIALPLTHHPKAELTLAYVAGYGRSQLMTWQLSKGKEIALKQGQPISRSDFAKLQQCVDSSGHPYRLYEIRGSQCEAWLLIGHSTDDLSNPDESPQLRCSPETLERIAQQCVGALHQIRLIASQRQRYQTLLTKNQELEQANQLKSEFLANTSHEIRTPLSSILGFTHLLQQQGFDPLNLRHQEYLRIILSSGRHLLALINDILDLSKIEANQMTLQWETINIEELCKICLTLVREKASDKGLSVQLELQPNLKTVGGDGLRLKQMLFNLLSNAVKFTLRGSVGLQVMTTKDHIHFTVWDSGTGISPEQQSLLFKPYSQIANVAVERSEGTGLGLVLTQKLAELHGGRVEVCSELNQGSRFTVVLPLSPIGLAEDFERCDAEANHKVPPSAHAKPSPKLARQGIVAKQVISETVKESDRTSAVALPDDDPDSIALLAEEFTQQDLAFNRVLVVEDNIPNAKLMLTYLSRLGYEVTWAKDGMEMWSALERSLPAVILMDVHLPDADGLVLTRQLKHHPRYQTIPVITQTAMAMKGDRAVCLESGADDYISKPIDLDALAKLMMHYAKLGTKVN
ncbi:response regulator [Phormidium sp. CLA17]|uniref:ATP-binding protein n=1 Tax=Leptolyngbya sp. Cla-17 TaxID=2803751 RepID=UPI0018D8F9B2|nr:ATP-binding protein [Leptolyngbya sp. Cla-17]MBM0740272.1 response regulator [Leptolyngbya sp. Cla-17]MBM0745497.1 response regulator [Leptolyngbya sp. Cla-17]